MAKRLIFLLYFLVLGLAGSAWTADLTLVTLGDSLTAGDGDDQGDGYPMRVQEMMQAAGHSVDLSNLGVSGWTSGDLVTIETWEDEMLGTGDQRRFRIGAAAFDRNNDLLYVLELFGDQAKPVVHVWNIQ